MFPELGPYEDAYFKYLIDVIRWIVELGNYEPTMETSAMASMMSLPCKGHIKVLFQFFAFMKNKHNAVMVFDPNEPDIEESQFKNQDWSATDYGECK